MPDVKERMAQLGVEIVANKPDEFKAFLEAEVKKWAHVVKQTGITIE
jgi:tripartite-type tricarboxylate transporter receptor subunit TctC